MGGSISPAPIQGDYTYTVYGGTHSESVVQFRLQSLSLSLKTAALARKIYSKLALITTYHR